MKLTTLLSTATLGLAVLVQAQNTPIPQGNSSGAGAGTSERGGGGVGASEPQQPGRSAPPPAQGQFNDTESPLEALVLKGGPLAEVVAQVEQQVQGNGLLPNILFDPSAREAVVPGDLTLRRVTPVQALALVAAASGCSLEPIFAPAERGGTNGAFGGGPAVPVIGYRFTMADANHPRPSPRVQQLGDLDQQLATLRLNYGEDHPRVVAMRETLNRLEVEGEGTNTLSGVGMVLAKKDGGITVMQILPDSPAAHSPVIKPGLRILSVAEAGKEEVDVRDKELQDVVQLLRGEAGTSVKIGLSTDPEKNSMKKVVSLVRAKLPTQPSDPGFQVKVVEGDTGKLQSSINSLLTDPLLKPAENSELVTKVYALGSILSGSDAEADEKHKQCQDLIQMTLHQADLNSKISPDLSFHRNARVLVVRATAAQQDMIGQVIKALKENETPRGPASLKALAARRSSIVSIPPPESFPATPFRFLMDQAEPLTPAALPITEAFAFGDVPRLTAALKHGEESAFTWLHGEWSGRINRYCFALAAGDEAFAGEIAQAVWLRLMRHVRVVHDEQALWNWIACAARHAASDLRRKGGRYHRALRRFAEWWQPPVAEIEADNRLPSALEAALSKLTADERALIEGRYFNRESLEAIGTRHGLSIRAVEGRLARLRTRLRELIAQELQSTRT